MMSFAQSASSIHQGNSLTQQPQNLHYFLVQTKPGSLKKLTNPIKTAFNTQKFKTVEVLESLSYLKISAIKGTKLEDIKEILANMNLVIIGCREEYSNTAPSFFSIQ